MSQIEKIYIPATDYPDFDYCIDQMMNLADKLNELIEAHNSHVCVPDKNL